MTNTAELQAQKAASRDKQRYVKITFDGQLCTCEPRDVETMLEGLLECALFATVTDVWMTQAEYEALPEFMGW